MSDPSASLRGARPVLGMYWRAAVPLPYRLTCEAEPASRALGGGLSTEPGKILPSGVGTRKADAIGVSVAEAGARLLGKAAFH